MDFVVNLRNPYLIGENVLHTVDNSVLNVIAGKFGDRGSFINIKERFLTEDHQLFTQCEDRLFQLEIYSGGSLRFHRYACSEDHFVADHGDFHIVATC